MRDQRHVSFIVSMCSIIDSVDSVKGGRMALVQGSYLYYHYMQDGFNDNVRRARR